MNEKNLSVFIDFGSSKIRLGIFNQENSKKIFSLDQDCISNFNINNFDIEESKDVIKNLIKNAEKKINLHIKNINLMLDTPDMFSVDMTIKKKSEYKKYTQNDIQSLLQEAKILIQNNYLNKKIIHMIVKKFVFDKKVFYKIPSEEVNSNFLIIEIKFICFYSQIWENFQNSFSENYLKIDNIYCSSYIRSINYNSNFDQYNKKIILDIGYGKSAITIFKQNRVLYFNILPIGSKHITNDISLLLKINVEDAEKLKKSLNESETIFLSKPQQNEKLDQSELCNQVIFARVDEIIKLNLTDNYFNTFLNEADDCILIFIGEGAKILNKNSIYLEKKFDFFKEINFFEENTSLICESGFNFKRFNSFQEVNFFQKKHKNKGFFEKLFRLLS